MYSSIKDIRSAIFGKRLTCKQLVLYYLDKIDSGRDLNLFLEVYADEALARAEEMDTKFNNGTIKKLGGMVIGLKDIICYKDHRLQACSRILDGFISQFSATAVERLINEDAIIIGRQNCDEFAMGSSNENSFFGPAKNSINSNHVPGGSSGGSAASVSSGMCLVSLGSDTGGSVRQPAAFCGVVGMKPTYSRISRYGLIAYASSFDTIGIIANNISDIALVMEIISGNDEFDSTVSQRKVPSYSENLTFKNKARIAYIKEALEDVEIDDSIRNNTLTKINFLKREGHLVEKISFPLLEYILPTYHILTMAEASTNLSRYDGVRYGYRNNQTDDLESMYKKTRSEGFGTEVKRRIMLGTFILSTNYYDTYFSKAQKIRRIIKERTESILDQYDFLILPTTPTTAFPLGKFTEKNLLETYLADFFTVQASIAGIPAISIPNSTDEQGLPIGLQIMTHKFCEEKLFAFCDHYLMK